MVRDPEVRKHAQTWPVCIFENKKVENLLFYEDPDYGFVINGLIKPPGGRAAIHDHGPSWTIYAVLEGRERIVRYAAKDTAGGTVELQEIAADFYESGDVDLVEPRVIHSEFAGERKSIAVIVRSQRSGTFEQLSYDSARPTVFGGPNQVPFDLS